MKLHRGIILASASPRRRELLSGLGVVFEVIPADINEVPWPNEKPASYALRNAHEKAREIARRHPGHCIIAADTIVVQGDHILEKPRDAAHAAEMLRQLSGKQHEVITGLCLRLDGYERADAVRTIVAFKQLSDEEIAQYVATGEPMDKAGAYAIQGGASPFVTQVVGSYSNVVGLPVETLGEWLCGVGSVSP